LSLVGGEPLDRCACTLRSSRSASASALSCPSSSSSSISAISGARNRWAKEPVRRATKPIPIRRTTMETISPPVVSGSMSDPRVVIVVIAQ
jgi:hypothetical protein